MTFRAALTAAISLAVLAGVASRAPAAPPADEPANGAALTKQQRIDLVAEHIARAYGENLRSRDPIVRCLAVVGLSALETPKTTKLLLGTLQTDTDRLVRLFAWEALLSRQAALDAEQRQKWVSLGLDNAWRGWVEGDFRARLLGAATPLGPKGLGGKTMRWFIKLYDETSHTAPIDSRTLTQMRQTLAAWKEPVLIRRMIAQLARGGAAAHRSEYILGGLTDSIAPIGSLDDGDDEPGAAAWREAQGKWYLWLREAKLEPARPEAIAAYAPDVLYMPTGEKITDPSDPKWRGDLELEKLRINRLEVCYAIDSTGSMTPVMKWVARDLQKMLEIFQTVSREVRMGAVFFRDEPQVGARSDYLIKPLRLTGDVRQLAKEIGDEEAGGGRGRGAAILEALEYAYLRLNWSPQPSQKVVIVISDTTPIVGTEARIEDLVKKAAEKKVITHSIRVTSSHQFALQPKATEKFLEPLQRIAELGGGKSIVLGFGPSSVRGRPSSRFGDTPGPTKPQIAAPIDEVESALGQVTTEVVRSVLPKDYWTRAEPLVRMMLKIATDRQAS